MQSQVVALHIVEVGPALPLDVGTDVLDLPGREVLAEAQQIARDRFAIDISTRLIRAREAGPAILREVEDSGAELLILGYHPKARVSKALFGSSVEYISEHAPCRVLVQVLPAGALREAAA